MDEIQTESEDGEKTEINGVLPVDRNYNWEDYKLDEKSVQDFVSPDNIEEQIMAMIESRGVTGRYPRFTLSGPTGTAKTLAVRNIATQLDAPFFYIQGSDGLREEDMIGMPTYVGDQTWWSDGKCVKALLSSREQPTVLLLDEVNRAPERAKFVLFNMLDDRCELSIRPRSETISGDPMNLIVFATMNEGEEYIVNGIDRAEKRRLGAKWELNHLGLINPQQEAELITNRTPIYYRLSLQMVKAANELRRMAQDKETVVDAGISNAIITDWARTAYSLKDVEDDPLMTSCEKEILNQYYNDNDREYEVVRSTFESHVLSAPVLPEDADGYFGEVEENLHYECSECAWKASQSETSTFTKTFNDCPQCESRNTVRVTVAEQ